LANEVQTSEKLYASFQLEVKNKGGHSSVPSKDNAIYHLAEGLVRLSKYDFPVDLTETTRAYFGKMATLESGPRAADMKAISGATPDQKALARLSASPRENALLRTTCVATMAEAGHAENALPQTARATVNCRIMPGESPQAVQKTLVKVLADDQIAVTPMADFGTSPASALQERLFN